MELRGTQGLEADCDCTMNMIALSELVPLSRVVRFLVWWFWLRRTNGGVQPIQPYMLHDALRLLPEHQKYSGRPGSMTMHCYIRVDDLGSFD